MKYLFILLLIGVISCKSADNTDKKEDSTSASTMAYKEIAAEKLGDDIQFTMNKSESMVLCKKVTVPKQIPMGTVGSAVPAGTSNVKLIVVDIKNSTVLFEKSIVYGSADWENDSQLRIVETMGANSPNIYLYNILTKKKTQIEEDADEIEKY